MSLLSQFTVSSYAFVPICNENWYTSVHAVQVTATHPSPWSTIDLWRPSKGHIKEIEMCISKASLNTSHHLENQQEVSTCGRVHYLKCPLLCVEDVSESPSSFRSPLPSLFFLFPLQLREEFDRGVDVQLDEEHSIHDVAALLKEFLRDMPDPLLTKELYTAFINTTCRL